MGEYINDTCRCSNWVTPKSEIMPPITKSVNVHSLIHIE